jgi:hypothetical protein
MDSERSLATYRRWYGRLLGFYPKPHRERFAESMQQTFSDLCRERARPGGRGFSAFLLWIFAETFAGIIRERATNLVEYAMTTGFLRTVKFSAIAVSALMAAGIVTLMFLARGTGEDIAGIVALALLVTLVSVVTAVAAAIMQSARNRQRS